MVTGEIKNKIDALWDVFAAGGLTNPLEVIEQITYLMFIRDLDVADNKKAKESNMLGIPYASIFADEVKIGERSIDGNQLKWSTFHDYPANKQYEIMQEWVFPFIKILHSDKDSAYSKYMDDAIFKIPTALVLSKVIDSLDEIYSLMDKTTSMDIRGDVYEYLLSKIASAGRNGQFRTPRHIIRMMVELMNPTPQELICDPACGTSGFLVVASDYLMEKYRNDILMNKQNRDHFMNHMFNGFDMDRTMLRIGAMNMMTHGVESPNIEYRDSLSDQNTDNNKYSMILANPPFKGSLDYDSVSTDLLKIAKTKKTELLFLALFIRMLKVGGRCACIVPDGFSLDDKRSPVKGNDIPDILERFKNLDKEVDRKRTEQSFLVDKQEIIDNDYDLSINKYKEVVYEKVEYPPTSEILADIEALNREIDKNLAELKALLNDGKEEESE